MKAAPNAPADLRVSSRPRSRRSLNALDFVLLATALALPGTAHGQPAAPASEELAPLSEVLVIETPPMAAVVLQTVTASVEPYRFADAFPVAVSPASHGRWEATGGGRTAVWRVRVLSDGANSLNFGFTRYRMPPGGWLRIYAPDEREVLGPYTEADNESHGELWTPLVSGGEAVVEVRVPAGRIGELELELGAVNRGFRDLTPARVVSPDHGSCHVDVACSDADPYREQVRSVGLVVVDGIFACTGVLLNNTAGNGKPYFLTADHCGFGLQAASSAGTVVVYWNYESPTCGNRTGGSFAHHQTGAWLRARNFAYDLVLVELDDMPDPALDLFLAGWDRGDALPTSAVGIHHPHDHVKSISLTDGPFTTTGQYLDPTVDGGGYLRVAGWDQGATEDGSSGSPLFDQNKRVIGHLSGGYASCETSDLATWYGRLAKAWTGGGTPDSRLSDWLDPMGLGQTAIDGLDLNAAPDKVGTLDDKALRLADPETERALSFDMSYGFRDRDGDTLTYAASSSDETKATASATSSMVTIAPVAEGVATVTVTATDVDGSNRTATQTFLATVGDNRSPEPVGTLAPLAPQIADGAREVNVSSAFQDRNSDVLTYGVSSSAAAVATATVSGSTVTVTPVSPGTAAVTVTATDAAGSNTTARQRFAVVVANRPPEAVGTLPGLALAVDEAFRWVDASAGFRDPDNDRLSYTAASSDDLVATATAAGHALTIVRATVTVTPISRGTATISVTATDKEGSGMSVTQTFDVKVGNYPPQPVGTLTGPDLRVGAGNGVVEVAAAFEDPENDTLTYAASTSAPAVAGASVSGSRVTLAPVGLGNATITVTATDIAGSNTPATQRFDVRVRPRRGVTVSTAALTVDEGSSGNYTVVLDSEPTGEVVVTPRVVSSTKVTVDPASLTFDELDWQTPRTVTVEGVDDQDAVAEPPVTIRHQVSGSDYGSVSVGSVRVTVVEDDAPTLSVEAVAASEVAGSLTFEVTLSIASSSAVEVDYATFDGSGAAGARAGSDYTAASGTLTFLVNSTASRQIVVDITDDTDDEEEEETFRLTLRNAQHASLAGGGSTLQVTGTIEDNDEPEVEVSFGSSSYGVTEGRTVDVAVRLDRDPERDLEIFLQETHHGGATDADYSGVPVSVAFGPGVRTQEFLFAATDDSADDDGESVVLSFVSLPTRVGGGGETTLAIQDNDGSGSPGSPGSPGGPGGDDEDDDDDDGGGVQPPPPSPPPPSGPPKADFTLTAECAGDLCRARTDVPVTFEDTSAGHVESRRWDFGDGTASRNRRIAHVWSSPGYYEVSLSVSDGTTVSTAKQVFLVEASDPAGTCEADAQTLCLQDSRYSVAVEWLTAEGGRGPGSVVHESTNDSGLFTFFSEDNWEVLIKVLDGCAVNGHVWAYGASTTDLGYTIRVTDTATGAVKEYRNEPGLPAPAITDGRAFPEGCRRASDGGRSGSAAASPRP